MTIIRAFSKRHPVLTYFVLTFAISWGSVLILVGPSGIPGTPEQTARLFPLALVAMLAGPSVAGMLLTGLVAERVGLRSFVSHLLRWQVSAVWYAVALLTTPLLVTPILWGLARISPAFLPGTAAGTLSLEILLPPLLFYVGVLPAYRVLMVWVYDCTESLLLAMLMHASLTACTVFILMPSATGVLLMIYYLILSALLWIVVAAVAVTNSGQRSRPPLRWRLG